jgi:hypothetical protein
MTTSNCSGRIERWLASKPESATTLRVSAVALGATQTIMELKAIEVLPDKLAEFSERILDSSDAWAENRKKETSFLAVWLDGDRTLLSLPFRITPTNGKLDGLPAADGSLESLISNLQAMGIEQHKLIMEMAKGVTELVLSIVEAQQGRIQFLEGQEIEVRRLKTELIDIAGSGDDQRYNKFMGLFERFLEAKSTPNPPNALQQKTHVSG